MGTLRDCALKAITNQEEEWRRLKEANRLRFGNDDAHLINNDYGREATADEKEAIKHKIDIELKGIQKALKSSGERPLVPKDKARYWKCAFEEYLATADLRKMVRWHKKVTEHPYPALAEQHLIDEEVENHLVGWKSMAAAEGVTIHCFKSGCIQQRTLSNERG